MIKEVDRNLYAYLLLALFIFLGGLFNVKNYLREEKKPIEVVKIVEIVKVKPPSLPKPYPLITTARSNRSVDIVIIVVLSNGTDPDDYRTSLNSLECYSTLHGYQLLIEKDDRFEECAKHNDPLFKRHCHIYQIMTKKLFEDSWFLFLDPDVGIVNPNKLIESFIEPGYDIYLYNRFYDAEFATQYLLRNTDRSRDWLKQWADMEFNLPADYYGTDSGALNIHLMYYLIPETTGRNPSRLARRCSSMWEKSVTPVDLLTMKACTKMVIGERSYFPDQRVKILPKGRGWAREMWVLKSHWAIDDFMVQSIKDENLKPKEVKEHHHNTALIDTDEDKVLAFPVLNRLNATQCKNGKEDWIMDGRLRITDALREKLFDVITMATIKEQYHHFGQEFDKFRVK